MLKMMIFFLFFIYIYFTCSFHSLIMIMLVELMVLFNIFLIVISHSSWVMGIMFLLISVSLSSYGISLVINMFRSKGSFYSLGFKLF